MRKGLNMINGIGSTGKGRIDGARTDPALRGTAAAVTSPLSAETAAKVEKPSNPAADLASLGAPVDAQKVAEIRAAIAEGRYPVDAKAIAEKMIALDLPLKF
jgi:negative regulator of flagellin synthesis FlgM